MNKKFTRRKKTLILTLFIFAILASFFLGFTFSERSLTQLELDLESLNLDLKSLSQRAVFSEYFEDVCDEDQINFIHRRIRDTTIELDRLEKLDLEDTSRYILLKQRHNINQVLFYTQLKRFNQECDFEKDVILFFFSSEDEEKGFQQGAILEDISREFDVIILPMDFGFTDYIDYFYEFYSPSEIPAIIINFDLMFEGLTSFEKISEVLR